MEATRESTASMARYVWIALALLVVPPHLHYFGELISVSAVIATRVLAHVLLVFAVYGLTKARGIHGAWALLGLAGPLGALFVYLAVPKRGKPNLKRMGMMSAPLALGAVAAAGWIMWGYPFIRKASRIQDVDAGPLAPFAAYLLMAVTAVLVWGWFFYEEKPDAA